MEWEDTKSWSESFDEFMSQFDDLFLRSESREKAKLYVRGLLADVERKNAWQLAEVLNLDSPHPLQRLVNEGKWDVVNKRLSLGLADYEVRTWHGWHRHMTLCFLAHTWLTLMSMNERQKKATSALDELQSG
ncbi:MAG: transposase [Anaerolineae bacterium]|nr:transposase [Anaerolineae bacterium]